MRRPVSPWVWIALFPGLAFGGLNQSPVFGQQRPAEPQAKASSVGASQAQTANADGDDDDTNYEPSHPLASLTVSLDRARTPYATLYLHLPSAAVSKPVPAQLLGEVLGCSFNASGARYSSNFVSGECASPLRVSGGVAPGRLQLEKLRPLFRESGLSVLTVSIVPASDKAFSCPPNMQNKGALGCSGLFEVGDAALPNLAYSVGYTGAPGSSILLILGSILLLPVVLMLWLRRSAARASTDDKTGVWFSYVRILGWSLTATLLIWMGAVEAFSPLEWASFYLLSGKSLSLRSAYLAAQILIWIPPLLSWLFCLWLAYPIQKSLRRTTLSRAESLAQGLLMVLAAYLPIIFFFEGIFGVIRGDRLAALWFAIALVCRIVCSQMLVRISGMQRQAITQGPLRDRAFAMAKQMGVKLDNLYFISTQRAPMANAFATSGNKVILTDYLLERLTRREADAVIGHELGHLKRKHLNKRGMAYLIALIACFWFIPAQIAWLHIPRAFHYLAIIIPPTIAMYAVSRKHEYEADAEAVAVTGDPEAKISALAKITLLNLMPMRWSRWDEMLLTHPATLRRARAIMTRAKIPEVRLPEILASATSQPAAEDHYPLPSSLKTKVFSTTFRTRAMMVAGWAVILLTVILPAVFASLARMAAEHSIARMALYIAGVPATIAASLWLSSRTAFWGHSRMKAQLRARAQAAGVDPAACGGAFIGLAPGACPTAYENTHSWDAGFLFLNRQSLVYWGEEARFALSREQVISIKAGPDLPGWFSGKRPYVRWRDPATAAEGTFALLPLDARSMPQRKRELARLAKRLEDWKRGVAPSGALPTACKDLGVPQFGEVTGASTDKKGKRKTLRQSSIVLMILAFWVNLAFGLPYGFMALLTNLAARTGRLPFIAPELDFSGWYVVWTALLTFWVLLLPAYRLPPDKKPAEALAGSPAVPSPALAASPAVGSASRASSLSANRAAPEPLAEGVAVGTGAREASSS